MIRTSTAFRRLTAHHLSKSPTSTFHLDVARSMSTSNAPAPGYETELSYSSARSAELGDNLRSIQSQISTASGSNAGGGGKQVQLVAVSKLKPASDILCLHREHGHAAFGENYVQELLHKAKLVAGAGAGATDGQSGGSGSGSGSGIEWHFIGGLQSNKCKQLAHEAGLALACVQTVDSVKKATELNKGRQLLLDGLGGGGGGGSSGAVPKLDVYVQVNTSGEEAKSGTADAKATLDLARHIATECPNLQLRGLMTIGSLAQSTGAGSDDADADAAALAKGDRVSENADFKALVKARDELGAALDADDAVGAAPADAGAGGGEGWKSYLRLSMGMSADFETAIRQGADTVRVGSALFGARPPKQASKQVEVDTAKSQS